MTFPVPDIASRYANGRTYPEYLAHMKKNHEMIAAITQKIYLPADDARYFAGLANTIRVLVISEDWCPDCALNVPVLMRVAEAAPHMEVRFAGRDDNLDLLEYAKKGDRKAIPTFLFFDGAWNLSGYWIERPVSVDALLAEWDATHRAPAEPDRTHEVWRLYRQDRSTFRDNQFFQHDAWRDTVSELRRILAGESISNQVAHTIQA